MVSTETRASVSAFLLGFTILSWLGIAADFLVFTHVWDIPSQNFVHHRSAASMEDAPEAFACWEIRNTALEEGGDPCTIQALFRQPSARMEATFAPLRSDEAQARTAEFQVSTHHLDLLAHAPKHSPPLA